MSRVMPPDGFRDSLEASRPLEKPPMPTENVPEVVASYLVDDGQWIDCIKVENQRALHGAPVAKPPAFIPMGGAGDASTARDPAAPARRDGLGNRLCCAYGCIPVKRGEPREPGNPGSDQRFFEKAPGGGALPPKA